MSRILIADPHVSLSYDQDLRLVRYVRSREPYASLAQLRALHDKIVAVIPARPGLKLLIDSREAPPRNDPEFEKEVTRALNAFLPHFSEHAFLVKSAVGRLQTQRLARQGGGTAPNIFTEEAAALRYLGVRA